MKIQKFVYSQKFYQLKHFLTFQKFIIQIGAKNLTKFINLIWKITHQFKQLI